MAHRVETGAEAVHAVHVVPEQGLRRASMIVQRMSGPDDTEATHAVHVRCAEGHGQSMVGQAVLNAHLGQLGRAISTYDPSRP